MIRVVLAGSTADARAELASELARRLGLPSGDGFVLADPPADPVAFDAELARRGADLDALVHLGGAPDALLDHYGRAVVEVDGSADGLPERVLAGIREALVAG
jgi:hypothetical protein